MSEWQSLRDVPDTVNRVQSKACAGDYILIRSEESDTGWLVDWLDGGVSHWRLGDSDAPYITVDAPGSEADDPVSPAHYQGFSNGAQVIDITEHLSFNRGNAVKYLARAGKKDPEREIEDLRKAAWYVQREITKLTESVN